MIENQYSTSLLTSISIFEIIIAIDTRSMSAAPIEVFY